MQEGLLHKMTQRLCICLVIHTKYNFMIFLTMTYIYMYIKSHIKFLFQVSRVLMDCEKIPSKLLEFKSRNMLCPYLLHNT